MKLIAAANPFASVDHVALTQIRASTSVMDTRVKPATAVTGKKQLTLSDCRALAMANCPDIKVSCLDELSKGAAARSLTKRMLPHLVLSSELGQTEAPRWYYGEPNLWNGTSSYSGAYDLLRGRELRRYTAEASWSPNDAAQAFLLADNTRKEELTAHYEKVRKVQEVLGLVDAVYFRLLGAQDAMPKAEKLASLRSGILDKVKDLYSRRLIGLEQLNDAQQKLTRARLVLTHTRSEIERQRNLLASKMGVSPNYTVDGGFTLVGVLTRPSLPTEMTHLAVWDMERTGLKNRPESYKAGLAYLRSVNDVKRNVLKYFPHVTGFCRYSRIEDKSIYDKDWKEVGINFRADLLDIWANMDETRSAKIKSQGSDKAFDAVASQVIAQVRHAAFRYFDAQAMVDGSTQALEGARELLQMAIRREDAGDLNRLAVDETRAAVLEKTMDLSRALGEASAALAELTASMATNYNEPIPFR